MSSKDVIIIGGGHNGLVTAFYLAHAGVKPVVLERREVVGGCAVTEEFAPGFKCSTLAHAAGPLRADVARDMNLSRHGLQWIDPDPRLFAPSPDGRALFFYNDAASTAKSIAEFSRHDAAAYPEFAAILQKLAAVLASVLDLAPPDVDEPSKGDLWRLLKLGRQFRALGKKDMFRVLRWGPMAVADLVAEHFENELVRAAISARGIFGANLGPWSAGSAMLLLLRAAADPHPVGSSQVPRGGMGALTQAMAAAAQAAGAKIRTNQQVHQILVKNGAVIGVALSSGEVFDAGAVISGADPKRTLLGLVDPVHLAPGFIQKIQHFRSKGVSAKVNLALDGLPEFTALKNSQSSGSALAGRIHIGPEIDYLERAFDHSKYGEYSDHPYLDVTIPTLGDPSLAPAGKHVMSVYMQYAPPKLRAGDWSAHGDALGDAVVNTLAQYAPDLPGKILHRQVLTPADFEETYSLTGGHNFHGELALDQLFTMRPLLNWARYSTPIRNLFLCSNGTHPGNGLTGGSGANAAREILKALK